MSRVESRIYNSNIDIAEIFVIIPCFVCIRRFYPPVWIQWTPVKCVIIPVGKIPRIIRNIIRSNFLCQRAACEFNLIVLHKLIAQVIDFVKIRTLDFNFVFIHEINLADYFTVKGFDNLFLVKQRCIVAEKNRYCIIYVCCRIFKRRYAFLFRLIENIVFIFKLSNIICIDFNRFCSFFFCRDALCFIRFNRFGIWNALNRRFGRKLCFFCEFNANCRRACGNNRCHSDRKHRT